MRRHWFALVLSAVGIVVVAGAISGVLAAQTPVSPAFEVASVKSNKSLPGTYGGGFQSGGRFFARNMSLRLLIAIAYGETRPLADAQIASGPAWMDSDGFDIEAKAADKFPETQVEIESSAIGELMLRALLADRFKLVVHKETRQLPVYALVMARSDGRFGPRLRSSSGADCASAPPSGGPSSPPDANALPRCGSYVFQSVNDNFAVHARFLTMEHLAKNLQNLVDRVVLARTALTGTYSFDLDFKLGAPARPPTGVGSIDNRPADDSGASIFTALQEQLGLKLESTRGPVDVLVIDHVEHPTED